MLLFYLNTGCAAVFMWVCRATYTILLKYTGISAVHILFIYLITNILVTRAMQFAVNGRVWVENLKLIFLWPPVFNLSWLSYSLTLGTTEIPQCDMITMFVQSDKYNPKGLLNNRTVWARVKSQQSASFFIFFISKAFLQCSKIITNNYSNLLTSIFVIVVFLTTTVILLLIMIIQFSDNCH